MGGVGGGGGVGVAFAHRGLGKGLQLLRVQKCIITHVFNCKCSPASHTHDSCVNTVTILILQAHIRISSARIIVNRPVSLCCSRSFVALVCIRVDRYNLNKNVSMANISHTCNNIYMWVSFSSVN